MMLRLPRLSLLIFSTMLPATTGPGYAQNIDCLACHAPGSTASAADFSSIYANLKAHHPVEINYPLGLNASPYFNQPTGHSSHITFFDSNGNGQPDSDEIQLFGSNGTATLTCASCHKQHGTSPLADRATNDAHLRVTMADSALCLICHKL